ncbi:Crp/Fnr family transcriptional regulator [Aestuariivita sp.]|jgi:CRP-like cAMP-binding protein|uniref:Crp/Fnr family transcriptional regulator n=1 Tax=Aestuariivita sp. TaxID=1872407 RepID=UPI00216BB504|nr:Crp/Fnr family transcriptional regulator [Aestuariivita sp.]MCE8005811.1 Crp/Fnr family transcriptional regulator [Aestuariivita sp.]
MIGSNAPATRLQRFVQLEECEKHLLDSFDRSSVRRPKGYQLARVGDLADKVWVLQSGWAALRSNCKQHGNQILRLFLPGDFIGLAEFGTKHAPHQIMMLTDGTLTEIPRKAFHREIVQLPRLSLLLFALSSLSLTAFHYQVTRLNTMSAQDNLKFFLLQLISRLQSGQSDLGNRFEVPMTQVEIGQAIGLTSIYVNKLLRRFIDEGQLEIERPYFRLKTRERWECETAFVDAFAEIDTSWFATEFSRPIQQNASPRANGRVYNRTDPSTCQPEGAARAILV